MLPLSLLLAYGLLAQSAASLDVNSMLAGLKDIKQSQTQTATSELTQTINDFSAAAATDSAALGFYARAVHVTESSGQGREQFAFRDFKKREAEKLEAGAIRACLRYMVISLQRAAGATDQQIYPVLLAYAQETDLILPKIAEEEIARQSVSENIFARWYGLGEQLSGLEDWESSPANLNGIYDKALLPMKRKTRDPAILQCWDQRIAGETARASNAVVAFNTDSFNQNRRPELLWRRAEDQIIVGMRGQGLAAMYAIVKQFPGHPSAGKWIDELRGLLTDAASLPPSAVTGTAH